jgi:hypothetical protein
VKHADAPELLASMPQFLHVCLDQSAVVDHSDVLFGAGRIASQAQHIFDELNGLPMSSARSSR